MATDFELPLLITFQDVLNRAGTTKDALEELSNDERDSILQSVHDFLLLPADSSTPFDSGLQSIRLVKQLQLHIALHVAVLALDNPAGTGSLSSVSIDSFSVGNTMAKNNSPFNDWLNMTQYGSVAWRILMNRPQRVMMI